jgi:hypothetical protein
MRIYLAARYDRNAEMRGVRDVLAALGHEVTSRWIDQHGGEAPDGASAARLNADPAQFTRYANIDLADINAAEAVIVFTSEEGNGTGGHHTELGYALALRNRPRIVIVGPRVNVFHTLPQVEHYRDWSRFVMAWSPSSPAMTEGVTA